MKSLSFAVAVVFLALKVDSNSQGVSERNYWIDIDQKSLQTFQEKKSSMRFDLDCFYAYANVSNFEAYFTIKTEDQKTNVVTLQAASDRFSCDHYTCDVKVSTNFDDIWKANQTFSSSKHFTYSCHIIAFNSSVDKYVSDEKCCGHLRFYDEIQPVFPYIVIEHNSVRDIEVKNSSEVFNLTCSFTQENFDVGIIGGAINIKESSESTQVISITVPTHKCHPDGLCDLIVPINFDIIWATSKRLRGKNVVYGCIAKGFNSAASVSDSHCCGNLKYSGQL